MASALLWVYLGVAATTFGVTMLAFFYTELVGPRERWRSVLFSALAGVAWPIFTIGAAWAGVGWWRDRRGTMNQ